jgi:hypothetical protein
MLPMGVAVRLADWLTLAAAPSFMIVALITAALDHGKLSMICGSGPSFMEGMMPMYLLMGGFHSAAWLKLIGGRWIGEERTGA